MLRQSFKYSVKVLLAGAMLVANSSSLPAQAIYGSLYGTVTDPAGAAVPNARVTATDTQKGTVATATTNGSGNWTIDHLVPDTYTVKIEAASLSSSTSQPLDVHADASQKVDIALSVTGSSQTVNVTAEAPALTTDRADVSTILDSRAITNLPNFNRNFTSFLLLTPGVQHSTFNIAGPENPQGGLALNSNGSNYGEQGFILDGTDNRDPVLGIIVINPTLDSISETKVTTQNYDAELGGAAGGIVSVTTKSGSNELHGDAFFFRHSDAFYARNPFTQYQPDPVTGRTVPGEVYGQFGGSLGGPIKKDKSFFFVDYQGLRNRLGTSLIQNVPTNLVRTTCLGAAGGTCDLSEYTGQVLYDPVTKTPYGAPGQIPLAALNAQALNVLRLLPAPNATGQGVNNNYVASGNGVLNSDQADLRLDQQAGEKLHAFGRYDYALFRLVGVPVFGAAGGNGFGLGGTTGNTVTQNQSATLGFDYPVRPSLLTDLRLGFLSYHVSESKYPGLTTATALGIPNLNTLPDTAGAPSFSFNQASVSPLGNQGCNCPLTESEQVFQLTNNWTKIVGNHAVKAGGDLRYAKNVRNASDYNRTGQFVFDNSTTGFSTAAGVVSTGSDLASFLVGDAATFQRFDVYINDQYSYQKRLAFYLQDTWRATPKLTFNYGVRWDIIYPETVNGLGHGGFASIAGGGILVAGANGIGTNGNERMDYTNVAGRFGVAYQVYPTLVLRAGVGQTYDTVGYFGSLFGSVLSHNLPVQANENTSRIGNYSPGAFATTLANPPVRPAQPGIPANGIIPFQDAYSQNFRPDRITLPRVDQYNVALQQALGPTLNFEIAYVGNIGERVYPGETFGYDLNQPRLPATPAELAAGNTLRRPYYNHFVGTYDGQPTICCSNGMNSEAPSGRALYNALQAKLEKRISNGLSFNANYSWSKAENYANDAAFPIYKRYSWGRNDTNRAHIFVISGVYSLPFGKNGKFLANSGRLVNTLVGGISLAGQATYESGRPFTATYQECGADQDLDTNFAGPGVTSDCRPNGDPRSFPVRVRGLNAQNHSRTLFTPVAPLATPGAVSGPFSRPGFGTFGNFGRNTLTGPMDFYSDLSFIKDIPFTERINGQFQFQAFNIFNHPALDIPTSSNSRCIDCTLAQGAGVITSLEPNSTMRRLQFAARITF